MLGIMKKCLLAAGLILGLAAVAGAQVVPEIQLSSRGVVSANYDLRSAGDEEAVADFSDSSLLLGFRQKLYSDYRSRFVTGFQFPDAGSSLGQVYFNHVFMQVENRTNILELGRTRLGTSLLEFPTLRDDDALGLTDVPNPFSDGRETEDTQFGNLVQYTRIFANRYRLALHGENLAESGLADPAVGLNSGGVTFQYRVPDTQLWNRPHLMQVGVSWLARFLDQDDFDRSRDEVLNSFIASTIINLRPDPVSFWDFRLQAIFTDGLDGDGVLHGYRDTATARSYSVFGTLRFLRRKLERPSVQFSLSGGFKVYPDQIRDTGQWQLVGNALTRLGEGFDLVTQVQYRHQTGDLAGLYGQDEVRLQVGFVYSVTRLWNEFFDDRDSLLNLEHNYIP